MTDQLRAVGSSHLVGLFADDERNALMTALRNAALTDTAGCPYDEGDRIYLYVENTPKISLVSEMVDELHRLGYCIKPNVPDQATASK